MSSTPDLAYVSDDEEPSWLDDSLPPDPADDSAWYVEDLVG
jgi:hypothetical protein